MKKINFKLLFTILPAAMLFAVSCTDGKRAKEAQNIIVSEVMASNRTGLQPGDGEPADWIELKNNSNDSISLKGFKLSVKKDKTKVLPDSIKNNVADIDNEENIEKEEKEEKEEKVKTWTFPDVKIGGGESLVVFAKKEKKSKEEKENPEKKKEKKEWKPGEPLVADFNLPKKGGTIQFLTPGGKVVREVKFGKVGADQALVYVNDSTYAKTYWQSPGFDNTREGYAKAAEKIDSRRTDPLKIWELMSRSEHSYDNWVELKNTGNTPVNLSDYSIAKKMGKEEGWQLPARTLEPGQIISIQLAGRRARENDGKAPFKLGNAESLILLKKGQFVDGLNAKTTPYGGSIGRMAGKKGFYFFATPTRGEENGTSGKRYVAESPEFDKKPGIYPGTISLKLKDKSKKVHYTLDGSEPNASSPLFKDSISIAKNTVVRAFAEGDSVALKSKTATNTYLVGVKHDLPIVNISVNNSDLYDYNTGIYAKGPGYTEAWPHLGANFFKHWTRKAHVEFFDNKEGSDGFSADCGLAIFGGYSRYEDKKSFRLKFRGLYGDSEIDYDFFGDGQPMELEDIILRAGSQDWNRCMIRDEFFTSLMQAQSPTLLTQKYRPVALYVNGDYFGLYYFREKINKDFVANKLNIPNDSINIIFSKGYNEEGSSIPYTQLMQYVSSHDMSNKENYDYVRNNVDLQGLIDYKLGEIYSGNTDVGNIRYVRSTSPESDKKWHFIFYDLDASWVGFRPTAEYYLSTGGVAANANVTAHNTMINRLLHNKEFRQLFLERLSHHMHNTFSEKNATAVFDNLIAQIKPEMKLNCERWPQLSYEKWEKNISDFRDKFKEKPKVMLNDLRSYLSITDAENKKYFGDLGF